MVVLLYVKYIFLVFSTLAVLYLLLLITSTKEFEKYVDRYIFKKNIVISDAFTRKLHKRFSLVLVSFGINILIEVLIAMSS